MMTTVPHLLAFVFCQSEYWQVCFVVGTVSDMPICLKTIQCGVRVHDKIGGDVKELQDCMSSC